MISRVCWVASSQLTRACRRRHCPSACGNSCWAIAGVAMALAPMLAGQESIFAYLQTMNAIYFVPILAVVVVGMTTRRVSAKAANLGIAAGLLLLVGGYFIPVGTQSVTQTTIVAADAAQAQTFADAGATELRRFDSPPPLAERQAAKTTGELPQPTAFVEYQTTQEQSVYVAGGLINTFHYVGWVFAVIVGLMLVLGEIAPRPEPWVHRDVQAVKLTPWKLAVPAGAVLLLLVFAIYAAFAEQVSGGDALVSRAQALAN